jgi:type I restriction enzyme S subunit
MNATLEAMAQALFKSWFVDFDPVIDNALAAGHPIPEPLQERAEARAALGDQRQPLPETIRQQFPNRLVCNEDMGWVPEGWEVSTVGEEIEIAGGGTPSTQDATFWKDGIHAFCTPKDMSTLGSIILMDTERHLTDAGVKKISSGQLPRGVVLMSSRAPIGYLAISDLPVSVNQGIIAMLPKNHYGSMYLLNWANFNMPSIMDRANGSTFLEISKKNFRPIPFLVPNNQIAHFFNQQTQGIYDKLLLNSEQTRELTALRDLLLPKLLSGQLRIPEAEQQVADMP